MNPQEHKWRCHWDEYGARIDNHKIVSIRVGVIEVDGHLSIATSVAAAQPVTITCPATERLGELMQWAQDEYTMLVKHDDRGNSPMRPQADLADVNRAMTRLDDIDAQLTGIATQVRALRAHFPTPEDADTDAPAKPEQASATNQTEGSS